jgi:hypothetical protein
MAELHSAPQSKHGAHSVCALPFICAIYCRAAQSRGVLEQMIRNRTHTRRPNTHFSFLFAAASAGECVQMRRERKIVFAGALNALSPLREISLCCARFFLLDAACVRIDAVNINALACF